MLSLVASLKVLNGCVRKVSDRGEGAFWKDILFDEGFHPACEGRRRCFFWAGACGLQLLE
ncbi:Hypothetical predicted protein [Podarcis lilfordi]|uniref:Uncharacterized protein n=1 Tax=Podarcis lilfordi TaxID=74358 RepID=A0AA35PH69_9SAUR|nr:Hypothetical predicted protein [Podarcis lilfordi]